MKKKSLYIWLIGEGEGLPIQKNAHLMRMGTIADYLAKQGHKVIWWSSTFLHGEKKYIYRDTKQIYINYDYRLILLHSKISYKKNISLRRIAYHKMLAYQFLKVSKRKKNPDIIFCAWPTPQFAREAVKYGKKNQIPVIVDARDMWPDTYVRAFPENMENAADIALYPLKKSCAKTFKNAYGITAMIDSALQWACHYAGREPGENDKTIYIGNKRVEITGEDMAFLTERWKSIGITKKTWNICFFSTFGPHIAIDTVIKAVKELSAVYPDIKLIIGGGGDREKEFKELAGNSGNIYFLGWLNNEEMTSLMKISKCGAFSIKNTFDFKDTFNTKAIQYLSEGLPILNSLSGFAKIFIGNENMGVTYECSSVRDCKEKILYLYSNEEKRKRMGENAQRCFYDKFESGIVNKQLEDYLFMIHERYLKQNA